MVIPRRQLVHETMFRGIGLREHGTIHKHGTMAPSLIGEFNGS